MRPLIKRARVCITRNLIREIKILRVKRGDEKKLAKFKRRAERLSEEIRAAKKIKDDEVSHFGVLNTRTLISILDDQTSDARTRVIAKFADFPELKKMITDFKEKFPDFEQFLGPGKKKLAKLQRKADKNANKTKKETNETVEKVIIDKNKQSVEVEANSSDSELNNESSAEMDDHGEKTGKIVKTKDENVKKEDEVDQDEGEDEGEIDEDEVEDEVSEDEVSEDEEEDKVNDEYEDTENFSDPNEEDSESVNLKNSSKSRNIQNALKVSKPKGRLISDLNFKKEKKIDSGQKNEKISKPLNNERLKLKHMSDEIEQRSTKVKKNKKCTKKVIKAISKEATVKRFSELLQEEEAEETSMVLNKKSEKIEIQREVDSFFMTADGSQEYLSVARQKKPEDKNSSNYDSDQANTFMSRNRNERFFSNVRKCEGHPNKVRIENTTDHQNSALKFGPKMEKRYNENRNDKEFSKKFKKNTEVSEEHLHPSWAAKKKQQEALKMGFQGKKIVFADD